MEMICSQGGMPGSLVGGQAIWKVGRQSGRWAGSQVGGQTGRHAGKIVVAIRNFKIL